MTARDGGGVDLLPSLGYLGHGVTDVSLDAMSLPLVTAFDLVVVDGTQDLHAATAACQRAAVREPAAPTIVVVPESALTALNWTWGFDV